MTLPRKPNKNNANQKLRTSEVYVTIKPHIEQGNRKTNFLCQSQYPPYVPIEEVAPILTTKEQFEFPDYPRPLRN